MSFFLYIFDHEQLVAWRFTLSLGKKSTMYVSWISVHNFWVKIQLLYFCECYASLHKLRMGVLKIKSVRATVDFIL